MKPGFWMPFAASYPRRVRCELIHRRDVSWGNDVHEASFAERERVGMDLGWSTDLVFVGPTLSRQDQSLPQQPGQSPHLQRPGNSGLFRRPAYDDTRDDDDSEDSQALGGVAGF